METTKALKIDELSLTVFAALTQQDRQLNLFTWLKKVVVFY